MKELPLGPLYYEFSRHNEPRLRHHAGRNRIGRGRGRLFGADSYQRRSTGQNQEPVTAIHKQVPSGLRGLNRETH